MLEALRAQLLSGMHLGIVAPGDRLPSVRQLATEFQVNPRVVLAAINDLEQAGLVEVLVHAVVPGAGMAGDSFRKFDASVETFDPGSLTPDRDVLFNRISPSVWTRGRGALIPAAQRWLRELESRGVEVINGADTFDLEVSKASQLELLRNAGARAPRTRVVEHPGQPLEASRGLGFR